MTKILVAIPPLMLHQLDHIKEVEARTRSELVREALRRYITGFRHEHQPAVIGASPLPAGPPRLSDVVQ